ncbi:hypothetical protein BDV40DRAFT_278717 [Aspergillus tamarii]|uniref:Uncharacterized protein n=1 Tax=Aspergillus tamarii TaxID=41984 RepID=A0A5N6UFV2_ASPTM|nr:hypothetical protein BDV40DRAFT_278717 [Aspergillus tamarii]
MSSHVCPYVLCLFFRFFSFSFSFFLCPHHRQRHSPASLLDCFVYRTFRMLFSFAMFPSEHVKSFVNWNWTEPNAQNGKPNPYILQRYHFIFGHLPLDIA